MVKKATFFCEYQRNSVPLLRNLNNCENKSGYYNDYNNYCHRGLIHGGSSIYVVVLMIENHKRLPHTEGGVFNLVGFNSTFVAQ